MPVLKPEVVFSDCGSMETYACPLQELAVLKWRHEKPSHYLPQVFQLHHLGNDCGDSHTLDYIRTVYSELI